MIGSKRMRRALSGLIGASLCGCGLVVTGCSGADNPTIPENIPTVKSAPVNTEKLDVKQGGAAPGSSGGMNRNPGGNF